MAKKIDALNRKQYGAVTAMLTVTDIKAAAAFYQKALGFTRRLYERARWEAHARRAAAARYDVDAWA